LLIEDIRLIEIEIHSKCNRKCSWCPNSIIDRSFYEEMDESIYLSLLNQLKREEYGNTISYSRYNEPMLNIKLLKTRTSQAKILLPNCKLVTNTNGDFLFEDSLKNLSINELSIMDYDCNGLDKAIKKLISCNIVIDSINYPIIKAHYDNITILYYVDWTKHVELENRGGFFNNEELYANVKWKNINEKRDYPCNEPMFFVGIDYNGNTTPCCNIRSDNINHKEAIMGDVKSSTLYDIINSDKAMGFKKTMSLGNYSEYPSSCAFCHKGEGRYTKDSPSINYE